METRMNNQLIDNIVGDDFGANTVAELNDVREIGVFLVAADSVKSKTDFWLT
jgi:hypothetical protein